MPRLVGGPHLVAGQTSGGGGVQPAALVPLTPGPGEIVVGGDAGLTKRPLSQIGTGFRPLVDPKRTPVVANMPLPIGAIGSKLYAVPSGTSTLVESTDNGATWITIKTFTGGAVTGIYPMGNGEVVVNNYNNLQVSSGWATNPATATWTTVAPPTTGGGFAAAFYTKFNVDARGKYVIVSEYGLPRNNAQKLRVSTDYGVTFTDVLDLNVLYPGSEASTHWHGVAVDVWANTPSGVRLWASHGDGPRALYYSDDEGDTWTLFSDQVQFTTLTATPTGLICGSDQSTPFIAADGIFRILQRDNIADMKIEPMAHVREGALWGALHGFAEWSYYHEETGLTYIGFRSDQIATLPPMIFVSDGYQADEWYRSPNAAMGNIGGGAVVTGGSAFFTMTGGGTVLVEAPHAARGARTMLEIAQGGQLYGTSMHKSGIAIGGGAVAQTNDTIVGWGTQSPGPNNVGVGANVDLGASASFSTAIGFQSKANGLSSTSLGSLANASANTATALGANATAAGINAVSVGNLSSAAGANAIAIGLNSGAAGIEATAVGRGAKADADTATALGVGATASVAIGSTALGASSTAAGASSFAGGHLSSAAGSSAVAVGMQANAAGTEATAVGRGANAGGATSAAFGKSANASGVSATALGNGTSAAHNYSVALGSGSTTTDVSQVAIGTKHIEATVRPTNPDAPAADKGRVYFRKNVSEKMELCVRFPTGAVQVIATEP